MDAVAVQVPAGGAPPGGDPGGEQLHHLVEFLPRQAGEGCCPPDQLIQVILGDPVIRAGGVRSGARGPLPLGTAGGLRQPDLRLGTGRALRDQLLGEDVERRDRRLDRVQPPRAHPGEQSAALHQVVAGHRKEASLRGGTPVVPGTAHPLEEGGQAARRGDLADHVDRPDVDAQLE